jgi:hypothetical protein
MTGMYRPIIVNKAQSPEPDNWETQYWTLWGNYSTLWEYVAGLVMNGTIKPENPPPEKAQPHGQ